MDTFLSAWRKTGRAEGGYSDNPNDSGGPTNWGITESVARAHGFKGDMRDLPRDRAQQIAKEQYWDILYLDDIAALHAPIAEEMFDTGLNCGIGNAAFFLQRALNRFNHSNRSKPDYPAVAEDGNVGRLTVRSLQLYLQQRGSIGQVVMLRALNSQQGAYYFGITPEDSKNEEFAYGWFATRIS